MSTRQQHPAQRENVQFAHRAALLTITLVGSTILLLQIFSGTNPLLHFVRLSQLVGTLFLIVFLLGMLARSTWGDLAPVRYGLFFYYQAPANSPVVPYVPEFVTQIEGSAAYRWTSPFSFLVVVAVLLEACGCLRRSPA